MRFFKHVAILSAAAFAVAAVMVVAMSFADTAPIGTVSVTGSGSGTVPIATTTVAGKVKVGAGLGVTTDGTLSVNSSVASFPNRTTLAAIGAGPTYKGQPIAPLATALRAGLVKVGTGLSVLPDGTLNNTGVAGVASFKGRGGAVLPAADDYSIGQISGAATVASTGSYFDLSGKPALAPVATSGSYTDLTSKPSLAAVATSGSYLDLNNKPTIPAAQVSSDWNSSTSPTQILNKPTIPTALSQLTQSPSFRTVTDAEKATWNGNTAPVTSVFGRTGAVVKQAGDYTAADVGADALGSATSVQTNLDAHTVRTDNPHATTKTQVGLGNVDNTSDASKPVSTAQQTALNLKLDKTTFNNFSAAQAAQDAAQDAAIAGRATAAQGAKADTALQPVAIGVTVQPYNSGTVMAITDSTATTNSTTAASATAVKSAYDLANSKLSTSGNGSSLTGITQSQVTGLTATDSPAFAGSTLNSSLGADNVLNGTFASDLTGWTGPNWSYSAGKALHTAGATSSLFQTASTVASGTTYKLVFDVSGRTAGTVFPSMGGVSGPSYIVNGTFTLYIVTTATTSLSFNPSTDFDGAIDNVTLQPVLNGVLTAGSAKIKPSGDISARTIALDSGDLSPSVVLTSSVDAATATTLISGRKSRGTLAVPTATQSGDTLFSIGGYGYLASAWSGAASALINMIASENFTASARGGYLTFQTTATGTLPRTEKMRVTGDGALCVGNTTCSGSGVVQAKQFQETVYNPAAGNTFTVDLNNGTNQTFTTSGATSIALPTPVAGKSYTIMVKYGPSGTDTVTFTGGGTIRWQNGSAPISTKTAGQYDRYVFDSDPTSTYTFGSDGGRNY